MALPAGFTIEQPQVPAMRLPAGFQLEQTPAVNAEMIPGQRSISQADAPLSTADTIRGVIETPFAVGANLASGPITYLAGAFGPKVQQTVAQNIQYQPRTQVAQNALAAMGRAAEDSKLPPFMPAMGFTNAMAPAARTAGDIARTGSVVAKDAIAAIPAKLEARSARIQEGKVAESYRNATKIDAAQAANQLNIALNPAESNPTLPNKLKSIVGGTNDIDARLAKHNEVEITNRVREDLGVPMEKKLDAGAIDAALNEASAPYKVVREMPVLNPTDDIISTLESLKKKSTAINKGRVEKVNALVDDVISELGDGKTGASVLDDIRQLRAEANSVYKQRDKGINPPKDVEIKEADARMAIANAYEQMIDANVTDPKLLDEIRAARVRMAQIYDHARALDYGTNTVDPMAYAKMLNERKGNMSGLGADIGAVAANYPNVVKTGAATADIKPRLTRSGIGGTLGFIVGGVPGAAAGAGAGYVASAAAAKRMMKPEYQKANALPKDYRPPANTMSPQNKNALRGQ